MLVMNGGHLIIKNPCVDCDCDGCGKSIIHLCNVVFNFEVIKVLWEF